MKDKIQVFGIEIDNIGLNEVYGWVDTVIKGEMKGYVVNPNVDQIVKLETDLEYREIYRNADLVLNDSVIIKRSARLLGHRMQEKLSGSDLLPLMCSYAADKGYGVYFLGGMPGVAETAKEKLISKYPELKVVGTYSPPFGFEKDNKEIAEIISRINAVKPEILFIGLGAPKQERFTYNFINEMDTNVVFCTGAAIDFQAGHVKRAPKIVQRMGMEWFYRFLREPKRLFKRYFVNDMRFFAILVKALFKR